MENQKKLFASKVNVLSSYIWLFSVVAFTVVILFSTKWFTHDPCYGEGCLENGYLLPMLASIFLGVSAFGMMIISGLVKIIKKHDRWDAPLGLSSGKITVIVFILISFLFVFFVGSMRNGVGIGKSYTGNDLFNAVNEHRKKNNLGEIKLSEGLCDNLVSRWKAVKENRQHEGFEEWVKEEGIQTQYGYKQVVELYISSSTPAGAIEFWTTSPGHEVQLDNSLWTDGCAYANENIGVVVMGVK